MSAEDSAPADDPFASRLSAWDEALAAGRPPSDACDADTPDELRQRLERGVACVRRLRRCWPHPPAPPAPRQVGRFEVRRELGRGAFGVVFLAFDPHLRREVALKVPRLEGLLSAELRQRFLREGRAAAGLDHPNVVPVYEAGAAGPVCYIASAYCPGPTLAAWLRVRTEPVPFPVAAQVLAALADAVRHAHARGVIHRDLKPSNVLLQEEGTTNNTNKTNKEEEKEDNPAVAAPGAVSAASFSSSIRSIRVIPGFTPKITDFGLAKVAAEGNEATLSTSVLGTPAYMAPEQASGRSAEAGPAADVYALGAILYELLTGRPPFHGETALETLDQVRTQEPVPPARLRPRCPRDLETICLKCLEKEPAQRYAGAAELADDLGRFREGRPIRARPVGALGRLGRWCRRNPAPAGFAGLAAAALLTTAVVAATFAVWQAHSAEALRRAQGKTQAALDQSRRLAAGLTLDRGLFLCERGDPAQGLAWLGHSLALAPPDDADLQRAIRVNLTGWARQVNLLRADLPHTGAVRALAFSPDGRLLLGGGLDGTARLWDVATGRPHGPPLAHDGRVVAVAFSPDGRTALTGSIGGDARLWETATGRLLHRLPHPAGVGAVAFGPGGRVVLTGTTGREARLWDAASGKLLGRFPHPGRPTPPPLGKPSGEVPYDGDQTVVAFRPDGRTVLTGSGDGTARLWDAATGRELRRLAHAGPVGVVAFSPDGRAVLTGSADKTTRLWDANTGRVLREFRHEGKVLAAAFSPDGRTVLTGDQMHAALWDVDSGKQLRQLSHEGEVSALAFSPDGRRILTGSYDQTARVWDAATGEPVGGTLMHSFEVFAVAFAPDGRTFATGTGSLLRGGNGRGAVRLWEAAAGPPLRLVHRRATSVYAAAYRPDGRAILAADADGTVRLWHASSGKELVRFTGHRGSAWAVAFSPDGRMVLTGGVDHTARLWDAATGRELRQFRGHQAELHAVAFSPDGRRVVTAGWDATARVWDAATGRELCRFKGHGGAVWAAAFSPDGRTVLTGSWDRTARLWDAATGEPVGPPLAHQDTVTAVAFSPDGRTALTASKDRTARLWDVATGRPLGVPLAHPAQVKAAAFSPDGRAVATGSLDGRVRLWDVATGKQLGPDYRHQSDVVSVAFSPDGRNVLSASYDNTARVWAVPVPPAADTERLVLWTETATGMEVTADGTLRHLDGRELAERRERLQERGGLPRDGEE